MSREYFFILREVSNFAYKHMTGSEKRHFAQATKILLLVT